jgi:hypothetical protein
MSEPILDLVTNKAFTPEPMVQRATDPVLQPTTYSTPGDWAGQFPQPLDPTEIITMCEEITLWQALPEKRTMLYGETWREMGYANILSGSTAVDEYLFFQDGYCPEEYEHSGSNKTVNHKNIGVKKNLSEREILHSMAVAALPMGAINTLIGGTPSGEGLPGAYDMATFQRQNIRDLAEKEIRMGETLVLNGWDRYLVNGSTATSALQFDGIENWATNMSCTMHTNDNSASGTFSATSFDRFLSESCAKPTLFMGHPQAIQEMMQAYFILGFQGSQMINYSSGERITPGFNFAGFINTGIGRVGVVADNNFRRTTSSSTSFQADIWAFRMTHNGEPLVYKSTQIPLGLRYLTPGCTVISFEIWAATCLIIKACCFHGKYTSQFSGRSTTTCALL